VLFRDHAGKPGALLDRCPHRNLALARGSVTAEGLQCAYHGWTFNAHGDCISIPAACDGSAGKIKVKAFEAIEQQGFIWIFMTDKPGLKPQTLPPLFPLYEDRRASVWHYERFFNADALHCAENFLDVPHTIFVHGGLFRSESKSELEFEVTHGPDWVQAEFFGEKPFDTFLGKLLIPQNLPMRHTDRFILPATTRVDYSFSESRRFIVMSQCTPITEDSCQVYTYMAFRFDPVAPLIKIIYYPLAARILKQDVILLGQQKQDIARSEKASFLFHSSDAIAREIYQLARGKGIHPAAGRRRMRI
jgi:phenylpropionate dioxygenase-like ring-hydroxylating dioxygenase large terminal subunit